MQFDDPAHALIVLKLLSNVDFIDSNKMTHLLKNAYLAIDEQLLTQPLICPLGSIQDSSALVCNKLIKTLFEEEERGLELTTELGSLGLTLLERKPSCIVFFDDNITSGTQLLQFFDELIDGRGKGEIVKSNLTDEQLSIFRSTPIRICFAVQLTEDCMAKIQDIKNKYSLDIQILVGKKDFSNNLDYSSPIYSTLEEAEVAKMFIMKISEDLYKDKAWDKEKLYSRLLGYGNLGKLTVFYHNIPKSLIPIFWKFGSHKMKQWVPLFPETKEARKIEDSGVSFDQFRLELIDTWLRNETSYRKPSLTLGFGIAGQLTEILEIKIPTEEAFIKRYKHLMTPTQFEAAKNNHSSTGSMRSLLSYSTESVSLSEEEYKEYLLDVARYNDKLQQYSIAVKKYIRWFVDSFSTKLIIKNTGTKSASNVKVEIPFNSGDLFLYGFNTLTKPLFTEKKPLLSDYKTGGWKITSNLFNIPEISFIKADPLTINTNYCIKENWELIGHNDEKAIPLKIHKISDSQNKFELPYEINLEEEAETLRGILTVNFLPVENWEPIGELDKEIREKIDTFFKDLSRSSYSKM